MIQLSNSNARAQLAAWRHALFLGARNVATGQVEDLATVRLLAQLDALCATLTEQLDAAAALSERAA